MAIHLFKGLGWFLCTVVVAPSCYMVTSQGAAERARLAQVEHRIATARKDIRSLETEFQTRANLAQIERWNGDVLALAAPNPGQYLAGVAELASLDLGGEVQMASLVVPAGAPRIEAQPAVMTAQVAPAKPGVVAAATAPAAAAAPVRDGLGKGRTQAVAMLEPGLLSAGTLSDLERGAASERRTLH